MYAAPTTNPIFEKSRIHLWFLKRLLSMLISCSSSFVSREGDPEHKRKCVSADHLLKRKSAAVAISLLELWISLSNTAAHQRNTHCVSELLQPILPSSSPSMTRLRCLERWRFCSFATLWTLFSLVSSHCTQHLVALASVTAIPVLRHDLNKVFDKTHPLRFPFLLPNGFKWLTRNVKAFFYGIGYAEVSRDSSVPLFQRLPHKRPSLWLWRSPIHVTRTLFFNFWSWLTQSDAYVLSVLGSVGNGEGQVATRILAFWTRATPFAVSSSGRHVVSSHLVFIHYNLIHASRIESKSFDSIRWDFTNN